MWQRITGELATPDGRRRLEDRKLIEVRLGGYRSEGFLMSGFTKARDDEDNARLVINFLLEASRLAPHVRFQVQDEGDYLTCPVIIRDGRMEPDREAIMKHIAYWIQRKQDGPLSEADYWDELIGSHRYFLNRPGPFAAPSVFIAPEFRS